MGLVCPSVRPSVSLDSTGLRLENRKRRKTKIGVIIPRDRSRPRPYRCANFQFKRSAGLRSALGEYV